MREAPRLESVYVYVVLLQDMNVECVALLNDTVGCLMSCAFHDHNTELGVILGTIIDAYSKMFTY